jgi:hypothetical protein
VGVAVVCSSNISATYTVDYSFDNPNVPVPCKLSRSTTTATLTLVNHGLTTADSIIVAGTGSTSLDGTFAVASVVDQNTITYTVANSGVTSSTSGQVSVMRVFSDITALSAKTANAQALITTPIMAVRLRCTIFAAGYMTMLVLQSGIT